MFLDTGGPYHAEIPEEESSDFIRGLAVPDVMVIDLDTDGRIDQITRDCP